MADLAKLVVRLEAETSKYQKELDLAKKQLRKFDSDAGALVKSIAKATGAAVVAGATALTVLVKKTIDQADHLNDLSKSTGVSVEQLSRFGFAAAQSGTDIEALGVGLRKFNQQVADAAGNLKGEAAIAFKTLGINVRDASGALKGTDQLLEEVSTKFSGFADGANKVALATALFGKSGADLIPFLNEGAAGLEKLGLQADRAGATISTSTARAADEFNDKLGQLKLGLAGLGNQLAADLLPALNNLGDQWDADKDRVGALQSGISGLATILKSIFTIGIGVASVFQQIGIAIGGITAAQVAFLHGNFRGALEAIRGLSHDISANIESDIKKVQGLFSDAAKGANAGFLQGGHGAIRNSLPLPDAPSFSGAKAADEANKKLESSAESARKKLTELNQGLAEQVATFDTTNAAATRYRLTMGSLSDDVTAAGTAGEKLRSQIIANAEAFDRLQNAKQVADALKDVNAQLSELKGNTVEAELARFDKSNEELVKKLRLEGNEAGQTQLATLRQLIGAQAQYNDLQQQAEKIQNDLAIAEERIENSRNVGAITELEALKQTSEARGKARDDLQAIYEGEKKIADQTGNPAQLEGVKRFGAAIQTLGSQVDLLGQRARASLESGLGTFFESAIKNVHNLGEAFGNFLDDLAGQLVKFAAQNFAQKLLGAILPANNSSSSGGGGLLAAIGGLFGGGRASGGPVNAGMAYQVNENTPRSEWFVPSSNGHIVPASGMGGVSVTQIFKIEAPQGTVSRATQLQLGNEAARGLNQAQRRNG